MRARDMRSLRSMRWAAAGLYGYAFGWPFLGPVHRALLILGLHGLGYDNRHAYSSTGEERFVRHVLVPARVRTCIDVGANVGAYSAMLAAYLPGPVYAIEPLSSSFEKLQRQKGNIRAERLAIGDSDGTASIYSKGDGWEGATLHKEFLAGMPVTIAEEVPLSTLDAFIKKHQLRDVDFIKVDTEGNEREVFTGMQHLLCDAPPRFIQFEFNSTHLERGHTLRSLARLLPGYEFYRLLPHGMVRINPDKYVDNVFLFCNIIAQRV